MTAIEAPAADNDPRILPAPGPWQADQWRIPRPLREYSDATTLCVISGCGHPAGPDPERGSRPEDMICVPHRRRFRKQKPSSTLEDFIATQASASPIRRPRGANTRLEYFPTIDFTAASSTFVAELRFTIGEHVNTGRWQHPERIYLVSSSALLLAVQHRLLHVSELRDHIDGKLPETVSKRARNALKTALPRMIATVEDFAVDRWKADTWRSQQLQPSKRVHGVIYWSRVTLPWLREGLKQLGREDLQSQRLAWSTVNGRARAAAQFSEWAQNHAELDDPRNLTSHMMYDYLDWVRATGGGPGRLGLVNTLIALLAELRDYEIVEEIPSTVWLRRGVNNVKKALNPKPFPADVLSAIDRLLNHPEAFPGDTHLMLWTCREACPRPSELLTMPAGAVSSGPLGYSLVYYMEKVDATRRIPLTKELGAALVEQRKKVAAALGPEYPYLFPDWGARRRIRSDPLLRELTVVSYWRRQRFEAAIWALYEQHGVGRSAIDGTTMSGPQIHRFRHTLATQLLNEGRSSHRVATFLGHASAQMLAAYAKIVDATERADYELFIRNSVDIEGEPDGSLQNVDVEIELSRPLVVRATMSNGFCTLHEKQNCDFLPTPCLSCTWFRTTPQFLPIHIRQRDDSLVELDLAEQSGRERSAATHRATVDRLDKIITGLTSITNGVGGAS